MINKTANTVLLVMDVQDGILARLEDKKSEFVAKIQAAVDAAHQHNIQVIFVVVGFRPGFPEVSSDNKMFNTFKQNNNTGLINPRPTIEPTEKDLVVTKRRVSAFTGSDLQVILTAGNFQNLILTGIATSGVVLSTLREAADKDYQITVISDLCNDADPQVHQVLTEKVFPRQATVATSEEWVNSLNNTTDLQQ